MKKAVYKVSMHGEKPRPKAVKKLIQAMKAMMPCEFVWNLMKPSAAKNKKKAMKIVAGTKGVVSVALDGEQKNQIVVSGDDFDPVKLAESLRRILGIADIVSVDSSSSEKKESDEKKDQAMVSFPPYVYGGVPSLRVVELTDNRGGNCCIM